MIHKISSALNTSISQLAYLFGVVSIPPSSVEFSVEVKDKLCVDEVSKCIADITTVIVINRQIKKIYPHTMNFINFLQKHFLRIFVWDVPDHNSSTLVCLYLYPNKSTFEGMILYSFASSLETVRLFLWEFCL